MRRWTARQRWWERLRQVLVEPAQRPLLRALLLVQPQARRQPETHWPLIERTERDKVYLTFWFPCGVWCFLRAAQKTPHPSFFTYKFSSLIVSTMLSLRIMAPETIMVAKTIARMPSTHAAIATQGRLKAKELTPPNWE